MKRVDLNCDMGEVAQAVTGGTQEELLHYVTSANVACGGHAGAAAMMQATIEQCLRSGVAIRSILDMKIAPTLGVSN
jgi:UPF0271 protein